ncbi:MAG: lamin tail domain-containing protein [Myxococcales bacterium]
MKRFPIIVLVLCLLAACGSAKPGPSDASDVDPADAGPSVSVAINEICARSGDWFELVNPSGAAVDLGGYRLADSADGGARLDEAVLFTDGTSLAPGEHLLILGKQPDAGLGRQTGCLDGGVNVCFGASFGISNSSGETLYLVGPDGEVVTTAVYPAGVVAKGRTWGRIPDGTGAFTETTPTPAAANLP